MDRCAPAAVAGARGSAPTSAPSTAAASATVRPCGPTVSWLCETGTTPARLVRPTVGLMPTTPFALEGQTIEPSVSVPSATAHRLAETATAEPELEPHGLRSSTYGFRHWPPLADEPLDEWLDRKFAHSLRLALPRMTAPPSRSRAPPVPSRARPPPTRASEPAPGTLPPGVSP